MRGAQEKREKRKKVVAA